MKNHFRIVVYTFLAVFLISSLAFAIPKCKDGSVLPNTDGFEWTDAQYWTLTDLTTGMGGEGSFIITVENAGYEADFGLYTVDNSGGQPTVKDEFQILSKSDEKGGFGRAFFQRQGLDWYINDKDEFGINEFGEDSGAILFDDVFGFYFSVYTDANNPTPNYSFYTDWNLNTQDEGIQHIAIEHMKPNMANIYLDDQLGYGADCDWDDMKIMAIDVSPAPVPEPASLALFGIGLLGLAGIGRKKYAKK